MQYIINLKSEQIEGVTHWSGSVAPLKPLMGRPELLMSWGESVLTPNKANITGEIERKLQNEDFISNQVTFGNTRVGSLGELMEILAQVQ